MKADAKQPKPVVLPWRVVIDTAEQHAWSFDGMRPESYQAGRPVIVETVRRCLGRHPNGYGDYTIETADGKTSFLGWLAIERKSLEDCQGTVLEFAEGRNDRFEQELRNLQRVNDNGGAAIVILECSIESLVLNPPQFNGMRSPATLARSLLHSPLAMLMDYRVPWWPAGSRRLAELSAFYWLRRYWKKYRKRVLVGSAAGEVARNDAGGDGLW